MFETAKWIRAPLDAACECPVFEKRLTLAEAPTRAVLAVTAVGLYQAYLNGERLGDALFTPGWTSYTHRLQYQVYELDGKLRAGENCLSVQCANGWAVGYLGRGNTNHLYADHISLLAGLEWQDGAGRVHRLGTDAGWEVRSSCLRSSEIYHGETLDLTYSPVCLGHALEESGPGARLIPQEGVAVTEQERIAPRALIVTPKGERVIDFGQNLAGYVELRLRGRRGERVTLSHAEVLDRDGNFYTENLELARCRNTYVLSGGEDLLKPAFSFQGFRYVRLDEYPPGEVDLHAFTSVAVYSRMRRTGEFVCGNAKVNRLYQNVLWGQRSNFLEVPTDCPQRDERVGWLGDIQVFVRTAAINFDVLPFLRKWLGDVRLEQRGDGAVGSVAPAVQGRGTKISAAWGDAAVICPWELYLAYGDREILRQNYPMMCRWVEYVRSCGEEEFLWLGGDHYGDWLASDAELSPKVRQGATQTDLIASAFFAHIALLMARIAGVLGREADAAAFGQLYASVRKAFRAYFMKDGLPVLYPRFDGLSANRKVLGLTQTSLTLILHFGLYEGEEERARLVRRLTELIRENGGRMSTGFVGTPYLLHVLSENGCHRQAADLFFQEKSPSWLFAVNHGATTVWEHWDGVREDGSFWSDCKNSFNHYSYGAVFDWVYARVLGIRLQPGGAGYSDVLLAPQPDRRFGFAQGAIRTVRGRLGVRWEYGAGDEVRYEMEIPPDCRATVRLPDGRTYACGQGRYLFYTSGTGSP